MNDYISSCRRQIEQNGFALVFPRGVSMRPLIWGGQHSVAVIPLDSEPRRGELIVFTMMRENGEAGIVHRLVDVRMNENGESVYVMRGDNNLVCEYINGSQIIGRVSEVHRLGGIRPWYIIPQRKFTVRDRSYRVYSKVWSLSWPLRRMIYLLRAHTYGLIARIRKSPAGKS